MRYILYFSVAASVVLFVLLSLANANNAIGGKYYVFLIYINIALATVLLSLIAYQVWHLYKNVRAKVVGSRLNFRLLTSFALMAIIPGAIIYLVSVNFLSRSIESWFNVKVESALDGGLSLGQRALDILLSELQTKAENMAFTLSLQTDNTGYTVLSDLREKSNIQDASILSAQGSILAISSSDASSFLPELPSKAQLQQGRHQMYSKIEPIAGKGLYMRVLLPIEAQKLTGETRILQVLQPVPKALSNTAESVQAVYQDYQELSYSRSSLKDVFMLTLTMVLMLAVLSALAIAFALSRKLSQPLTALAEGTRLIAAGDYSSELPSYGNDELGVLVKSFNSMTKQLSDATKNSERNRQNVEAARAYLETILSHLSSGVMTINERAELRVYNLSATNILGISLVSFKNKVFTELAMSHDYLSGFIDVVMQHYDATQQHEDIERNLTKQIEITHNNKKQILMLRVTRLPEGSGHGLVVVFDDVTSMAQAQRDAAWAEVARRLAHEIKNPLTPIQLSAERLQHKLSDKLLAADAEMLNKATDTIVNQVQAMKSMVNEFSEYARTPSAQMVKLNLNDLILDVSRLYNGEIFQLKLNLQTELPMVNADATMMRQMLHNLLQNAKDAIVDIQQPEIELSTLVENDKVKVTVADNGQGFPADVIDRAFEPYITTKAHGTGLGLAIVKKMIEEHRGQIRIENRPQGGASISVMIPIDKK